MARHANEDEIVFFRKYLKKLRKTLTNEEIAEKLDIDPTYLSAISSGKRNPGGDLVDTFKEVFKEQIKVFEAEEKAERSDDTMSEEELLNYLNESDENKIAKSLVNIGILARSNDKLAESNNNISESNLTLSQMQKKILDRLLP